jgi:hypothetical protein
MGVVASAVIGNDPAVATVVAIKPPAAPAPTRAVQPQRPTLPPPIGVQASPPRAGAPAQTYEAPTKPAAKPVAAMTPAQPKVSKTPDAFADLESLEAEMARLLGRDA